MFFIVIKSLAMWTVLAKILFAFIMLLPLECQDSAEKLRLDLDDTSSTVELKPSSALTWVKAEAATGLASFVLAKTWCSANTSSTTFCLDKSSKNA